AAARRGAARGLPPRGVPHAPRARGLPRGGRRDLEPRRAPARAVAAARGDRLNAASARSARRAAAVARGARPVRRERVQTPTRASDREGGRRRPSGGDPMSRAEPAVALDEPTLALETGPTLALGAEAPGADAPARLESCLVALHGVRPGRRWNLDRPQLLIGRGEHCEIVLPIDTVSRRHARLVVRAGGVSLQDRGCTNGTAVNDVAVAGDEEVSLSSGDLVRVGGALLRFLCDADLEALYHEEIHRTSVHDGLTGACSRRRLFEQLEREMSRSRRHGRPLALLLVDVDRLGRLNDDLGHLSGDAVLREVAVRLAGRLR